MGRLMEFVKAMKYNIGFIEGDLESVISGAPLKVNWLKHSYNDRWFADPFIMDVTDDEIIVLVEEWYDPIQRGRITKLVVDKKTYKLLNLKVMIDEGFHMSFPAITLKDDGLYIQPECCNENLLIEYKYDQLSDSFVKNAIIADLPLADSVRNSLFDEELLFSTKLPDANGKELGIYSWDQDQKKFRFKDTFLFEENISRMAGNFFTYKGKIYRPAQVCIKSYGDAVSLQEVSREHGKWAFKEIRRLYSPDRDLDLGFHTFNVFKGTIVVDGLGFRRPALCRMLRKIKAIVKTTK